MAEILLQKFSMLADLSDNGTYPEFTEGSQINVYLEDSDESIVVRQNDGTLITNGPTLGFATSMGSTKEAGYQYCTGNDLTVFIWFHWYSFPYFQKRIIENSAICTGDSCSLAFTNIEKTLPTDGNSDGSITANASNLDGSITAIQFGIGSEFNYGEGQASPTFNNLPQGVYTIYAVNQVNCQAEITVLLLPTSIGNIKYRIGYNDLNENQGRFDIYDRNFSGSLTEVVSGAQPVIYNNLEKDQFDIFKDPIRASSCDVSLIETTKFQYRDLFTQDSRRYLGIWYKDTGSGFDELWRGYLTPSVFSSPYTYQPEIKLTFIDGLNKLDRFDYADGSFLYNDIKLIKVISNGLSNLDLELPIRVAINLYETNHNTTSSDDPLDQTYIDQEAFYNEDHEPLDYFEIIQRILTAFGAKLVQWGGYWWIIRIEESKESNFDYREFDTTGDYVSNGTYSPRLELRRSCVTDARLTWAEQDQQYDIIGAPKIIKITNNMDLRESLLENFNFNFDLFLGLFPRFWSYVIGDSNSYAIQETINGKNVFSFNVINPAVNLRSIDGFYAIASQQVLQYVDGDKLKFSFDFAVDQISADLPFLITKARFKIGDYYLLENETWTTTPTDYRFYTKPQNGFATAEVIADVPPLNPSDTTTVDVFIYSSSLSHADYGINGGLSYYDGETDFRAADTDNAIIGKKISVHSKTLQSGSSNRYYYIYTLEPGTEAENAPSLIRPDDYATSGKVWKLQNQLFAGTSSGLDFGVGSEGLKANFYFYFTNVIVTVLPNGQNPTEETRIDTDLEAHSELEYNYDIYLSDVPRDPNNPNTPIISSDRYLYNSFFKLSDGSPTTQWARDGVAESTLLQAILAKTLVRQYTTPSSKISGTLTSQVTKTSSVTGTHIDLTPLNSLVETMDEGKIYYLNGLTIDDKNNEYQVNIVDSKATAVFGTANGICDGVGSDPGGGDDGDGGDGGAFQGGFSSGFGSGFEIIFN